MAPKQPLIVNIRRWSDDDLPMLERLMGDPAKAGTGALDEARAQHQRYLRDGETSRRGPMFAITLGEKAQAVGSIGYWQRVLDGEHLWETGWSVLPEYQGQGIALAAIQLLLQHLRKLGKFRFLHAFPAADSPGSNAICQEAGFELLGEVEIGYPRGHTARRNDWRLDLFKSVG